MLEPLIRTLGQWAERGSRAGGGSTALILVRLSDRLTRMSSSFTAPPRPASSPPPDSAVATAHTAATTMANTAAAPAESRAAAAESPWRAVRLFGLTVLWLWRVTTAPIRLTVWVAEAVVTLSMAAVIVGAAAWAMGMIPDETVLRLARPLVDRLGGFIVHSLEQVLQSRGGGG